MRQLGSRSVHPMRFTPVEYTASRARLAGSPARWASLATLLLAVSASADAEQKFPTKPIRMIIANTVGSGPDVLARMIGGKLTEAWGQQIVVDSRPGASGLIGAELVAKSAADGYTLWMSTMTQLISTTMYQRFHMATEFAPVTLVGLTPHVIAVTASLPVKSIAELIAYAKARPGQILYGSAGQGSTPHLCMELFKSMAGIDLVHVPYKGVTIALTDMMGGQIHAVCPPAPLLPQLLQSGKVRALAVTVREPSPLAPGLPPIADTVPGYELVGWYGILAPLGTPKEIISRINLELVKALKNPEMRERLAAAGIEAVGSTSTEFGVFLQKETVRWGKLLREAGIRPNE